MCRLDRPVTHTLPSPSLQIINYPVSIPHAREAYGWNGVTLILVHSVWVHIPVPRPIFTAVVLGFTMSLQVVILAGMRTLMLPSTPFLLLPC
jgi:hypothetical protein